MQPKSNGTFVIIFITAAAETNITKKRLLILDLKGCLPCGKQPFFLKQFFTQKTVHIFGLL
ncbi:MAG: hypothetical protein ACI9AU_000637 [Bacteroidia bacterium]|jgi:hypothetical protein